MCVFVHLPLGPLKPLWLKWAANSHWFLTAHGWIKSLVSLFAMLTLSGKNRVPNCIALLAWTGRQKPRFPLGPADTAVNVNNLNFAYYIYIHNHLSGSLMTDKLPQQHGSLYWEAHSIFSYHILQRMYNLTKMP